MLLNLLLFLHLAAIGMMSLFNKSHNCEVSVRKHPQPTAVATWTEGPVRFPSRIVGPMGTGAFRRRPTTDALATGGETVGASPEDGRLAQTSAAGSVGDST